MVLYEVANATAPKLKICKKRKYTVRCQNSGIWFLAIKWTEHVTHSRINRNKPVRTGSNQNRPEQIRNSRKCFKLVQRYRSFAAIEHKSLKIKILNADWLMVGGAKDFGGDFKLTFIFIFKTFD